MASTYVSTVLAIVVGYAKGQSCQKQNLITGAFLVYITVPSSFFSSLTLFEKGTWMVVLGWGASREHLESHRVTSLEQVLPRPIPGTLPILNHVKTWGTCKAPDKGNLATIVGLSFWSWCPSVSVFSLPIVHAHNNN